LVAWLPRTGAVVIDRFMKFIGPIREVVSAYQADHGGRLAGSLAYKAVFALAPLLLVAVSVAGFVFGAGDARRRLVEQIEPVAGSDVADLVADLLDQAVAGRNLTGLIGLALLAWTASGLFLEVKGALDIVFESESAVGSSGIWPFVKRRVTAVAAALSMGVVLMAVILVNALAGVAESWAEWPGWAHTALAWGGPVGSLIVLVGLFAVLFRYVPGRSVPWEAALRGSALTAAGFVLASVAIGAFFDPARFSGTGFAGSFVLILFTIYVLAQVVLFGAETIAVHFLDQPDSAPFVRPADSAAIPGASAEEPTMADRTAAGVGLFAAGLAAGAWLVALGRRKR